MVLGQWDWCIIGAYFAVTLGIGLWVSRRAAQSSEEFFLGGRNMPWWLLGVSMVATTFSTDTPNLVTDLVRTRGVSGNWAWWAFLLTGMLTVFVYAKLWRRSSVATDMEFYELRYSGKGAAFLRGFRAIYLGVFFNVMIMATVTLAAIKIAGVLLGLSPLASIALAMVVTAIFSSLGGFRAVLLTDFILFAMAMVGALVAAVVACRHPAVGGLTNLFSHARVADKLNLIPVARTAEGLSLMDTFVPVFLMPIAVQWWSVWYPGAEPGGGGYLAQRMLSAKDEHHALKATLLFNVCHYALRPWPWILVALASLVVFPDLESLRAAFPHVDPAIVKDDIAYPAMLTFLPGGLIGLVVASLMAAYMSTMSTHLNWGASYIVNDVYRRFIRPQATEKNLILVGRVSTVALMVLAGAMALALRNAVQAFEILLQIGAGTGLIFILRWFWWRINAWTEIAGMVVSFVVALCLQFVLVDSQGAALWPTWVNLLLGVGVTTAAWMLVTLVTPPTGDETLRRFYRLVRPGGPGWNAVLDQARAAGDPIEQQAARGDLPRGILCMCAGCLVVYSVMFATGFALYGRWAFAVIFSFLALAGGAWLWRLWPEVARDMAREGVGGA